ncbi:MAG: hypothetical protein RBR43_07845 [Desulfuromonadaceae bacterium]|nr:hypothetical protein [Desulfuromonadaceae bacterium]
MSDTAIILKNITSQYDEQEDRIRLSGNTDKGKIVFWLTWRLAQRLLPLLLQWLEQHSIIRQTVTRFNFSQQNVQATDQPEQRLPDWLISSVNITTTKEQVRLIFKGTAGQSVCLILETAALEEWLEIIHRCYRQAEWPLTAWPEWMAKGAGFIPANAEDIVWQ